MMKFAKYLGQSLQDLATLLAITVIVLIVVL